MLLMFVSHSSTRKNKLKEVTLAINIHEFQFIMFIMLLSQQHNIKYCDSVNITKFNVQHNHSEILDS